MNIHKNKCIICGRGFETKRPAKTCSDKCRQEAKRTVTDNYVTDNVTDNQVEVVTDKEPLKEPLKVDKSNYAVVGESWARKDRPVQKMYECDVHREHCEHYCDAMCDENCKHTLKEK